MNTLIKIQLHTEQTELQRLFEDYISECEYSKKLRSETIRGYISVFKNFQNQMPEVRCLKDLSSQLVSEFFKRLSLRMKKEQKEIKNSTLRTYYNKLIVFFRWLEQQDYIEKGREV